MPAEFDWYKSDGRAIEIDLHAPSINELGELDDDVEFATLDWVSWFNEQRLLGPIGDIPPAEFEQMYYQQQQSRLDEAGLN